MKQKKIRYTFCLWVPFIVVSGLSVLAPSTYFGPFHIAVNLSLSLLSVFCAVRIIRHYGFFSRYTLLVLGCLMFVLRYAFMFFLLMFFWQNGFPV